MNVNINDYLFLYVGPAIDWWPITLNWISGEKCMYAWLYGWLCGWIKGWMDTQTIFYYRMLSAWDNVRTAQVILWCIHSIRHMPCKFCPGRSIFSREADCFHTWSIPSSLVCCLCKHQTVFWPDSTNPVQSSWTNSYNKLFCLKRSLQLNYGYRLIYSVSNISEKHHSNCSQ